MTLRVIGFLSCALLAGLSGQTLAATPAQAESQDPQGADAGRSAQQCIEQLGSDSYKKRRAAERRLRALASGALPALQSATESDDPEVQWRVKRLIRQIESGGGDVQAREPGQQQRYDGNRDARNQFEDLFRRLERDLGVAIPGRRFFRDDFFRDLDQQVQDMLELQSKSRSMSKGMSMQVGPDGVRVEVQEKNDKGKTETKVYEAPDMESFKKQHPDVLKRHGLMLGEGNLFGFPQGLDLQPFTLTPEANEFRMRLPQRLEQLQLDSSPFDRSRAGERQETQPADGERLGVYIRPEISASVREYLALDNGVGLQVESVEDGSLADSLGLKRGDIITAIGGRKIGSPADVRKALSAIEAGSDVEVQFVRKGSSKTASVVKPAAKVARNVEKAAGKPALRIEARRPGRTRIR